MSDQQTHTDDRTPPPGIEVIGELPPGVPWWDAERLGVLQPSGPQVRVIRIVAIVAFLTIGVSLGSASLWGERIGLNGTSIWLASAFGGFCILLSVLLAVEAFASRTVRFVLQISDAEVVQSAGDHIWMRALGLNAKRSAFTLTQIQSVKFDDRKPRHEYDLPKYIAELEVFGVDDRAAGRKSHDLRIGVVADRYTVRSLLTYRIAKAKGETPPPLEFS